MNFSLSTTQIAQTSTSPEIGELSDSLLDEAFDLPRTVPCSTYIIRKTVWNLYLITMLRWKNKPFLPPMGLAIINYQRYLSVTRCEKIQMKSTSKNTVSHERKTYSQSSETSHWKILKYQIYFFSNIFFLAIFNPDSKNAAQYWQRSFYFRFRHLLRKYLYYFIFSGLREKHYFSKS